jgi:hypothetical protein
MKIAYLHGLESRLSEEKRSVISRYGEVVAPVIEYREHEIIKNLSKTLADADVYIGSSMGGYAAHLLAMQRDKACLLFNPAFPYRSIPVDISGIKVPLVKSTLTYIVLGKKDPVILYQDNINCIRRMQSLKSAHIISIEELEHRIPFDIFEKSVFDFFKQILYC